MEKREDTRDRRAIRVAINSGLGLVWGQTFNISPTGIGITMKTKRVFNPGEKVHVTINKMGSEYNLVGMVRWYHPGVTENKLGIEFDQINQAFCKAVMNRDVSFPGSKDKPFRKVWEDEAAFKAEYQQNLRFGGMFLPAPKYLPPLNSSIWIEIVPPGVEQPMAAEARVVIHQDQGFGVMFNDPPKLESMLAPYAS